MKLSKKCDYALRAMFTLAEHYGKGPLSVRELADRNFVPRRFLEQIMRDLKEKGWVESVAGRDGGFVLAKPPELVTMGQVVRHFDGLLAPISCVSVSHYEPCKLETVCRFRRTLLDIRNYVSRLMDSTTLASLIGAPVVRREEVFLPGLMGEGI